MSWLLLLTRGIFVASPTRGGSSDRGGCCLHEPFPGLSPPFPCARFGWQDAGRTPSSPPPGDASRLDRRVHGLIEVRFQPSQVLHPFPGHHHGHGATTRRFLVPPS